jgi:hypothetical protein
MGTDKIGVAGVEPALRDKVRRASFSPCPTTCASMATPSPRKTRVREMSAAFQRRMNIEPIESIPDVNDKVEVVSRAVLRALRQSGSQCPWPRTWSKCW